MECFWLPINSQSGIKVKYKLQTWEAPEKTVHPVPYIKYPERRGFARFFFSSKIFFLKSMTNLLLIPEVPHKAFTEEIY